ncbi:hypothetical protein ACFFIF_09820 [Vagococcus entomophilus]|uniref:Uncharacterized protein n=1 Tax=Vagococcus entomophilus TaxID=1160095 RepID=A0A430AGB7_9ENTE|nr:hypothetical protein [Vagococcus entomophilus]RSU06956.1 hypothetical protein CBF30_06765 [Vagococcus entomophilus]
MSISKKLGSVVVAVSMVMILFTGCGKNTKKEMVEAYQEMQKASQVDYTVTVPKFDLKTTGQDSDQVAAYMKIINTQLNSFKVSGSTIKSGKTTQTDVNIEFYGQKIPVTVKANDSTAYVSLQSIEKIMQLVVAFKPELAGQLDEAELKELSKQYVEMTPESSSKSEQQNAQKMVKLATESLVAYFQKMDEKRFTEKDKVLSVTLKKNDLTSILSDLNQRLAKEAGSEKISSSEMEKSLKDIKSFDLKAEYNKDKKVWTFINDTAIAVEGSGTASFEMNYKVTPKNIKNVKIDLPKKENILSESEAKTVVEDLFSQHLSDDDFNELMQQVTTNKDLLDENAKTNLLTTYKDYLSEQQYQELEKALK